MIRYTLDTSYYWLRGDIDYGGALWGDIDSRGSILNPHCVNGYMADTYSTYI